MSNNDKHLVFSDLHKKHCEGHFIQFGFNHVCSFKEINFTIKSYHILKTHCRRHVPWHPSWISNPHKNGNFLRAHSCTVWIYIYNHVCSFYEKAFIHIKNKCCSVCQYCRPINTKVTTLGKYLTRTISIIITGAHLFSMRT